MKFMYKACSMLVLATTCAALKGSESLLYRKADLTDSHELNAVMGLEGIHDSDKIVILPHKFRLLSIESSIQKSRFFVARTAHELVGYKKLFLVDTLEERNDIFLHEIRCTEGILVDQRSFKLHGQHEYSAYAPLENVFFSSSDTDSVIYDGADFTKADQRGKGINHALTTAAFTALQEPMEKLLTRPDTQRIILVYGLTYLNDYNDQGEGRSRTPGIVHSFALFIHALTGSYPSEIQHYRYRSFMPTFNLENEECIPKPDSEAIPGYGNVLVVTLLPRT